MLFKQELTIIKRKNNDNYGKHIIGCIILFSVMIVNVIKELIDTNKIILKIFGIIIIAGLLFLVIRNIIESIGEIDVKDLSIYEVEITVLNKVE